MNTPAFDPKKNCPRSDLSQESITNASPGPARLRTASSSLSPEKLAYFRESILRASDVLNSGRGVDLRELYSAARHANPAIQEFGDDLLREATGQAGVRIVNCISEAVLLPHNELLVFNLCGGEEAELVRASVTPESWQQWPGLEKDAVWSANIRTKEITPGIFGMSVRECAFVQAGSARADALEFFETLKRGAWDINVYFSELGCCFEEGWFDEEEYAQYMGEARLRHKLLQQSRDYLFAARLVEGGDPTADPVAWSRAILRPGGVLERQLDLARANPFALQTVAWGLIDLSGTMGGIIAEMEEHMAADRDGMRHCAFLDRLGQSFLMAEHQPQSFRELVDVSNAKLHTMILMGITRGEDPLSVVHDGRGEPLQLMRDAYTLGFIPLEDRPGILAERRGEVDRDRLTLRSTPREIIARLGQGHGGAINLLTSLILARTELDFYIALDRAGLRGKVLWAAYEVCDSSEFMLRFRVESGIDGLADQARDHCGEGQ